MSEQLEQSKNLLTMSLLAVGVGVVAGVGAWIFRVLIAAFHNIFFLGTLSFKYDANLHTVGNPWGAGIILVPVIGAIIVVWLVKNFAPEAKGHGVPEVMDAIYYGDGIIRPVVSVIKSLASAICIGSGGSVGREGPIIQIGSAFGSTLGQFMRLPHSQRITLIATGAGAGIAATFNAPLGGVAFAMELLLVSINASNVLPVALGTGTASYVGRALLGAQPSFNFPPLRVPHFHLSDPGFLFLFVPFGAIMGLVGFIFVRGIYWAEDRFDSMPGNDYTRHISGMLTVGIMIYLMYRFTGKYYVQGVGYATIMDILKGTLTDPFFLFLLFALKYAATCLTLGSGGSGGVFSPALFMGATLGGIFGHTAQLLFPQVDIIPESFVAAGMAAGFGGSTGAIITAAVMVLEMTEDSNAVLPIIITVSIALGVRKWLSPGSIYTLKLTRRGHAVPEGLQAAIEESRAVKDLMATQFRFLERDAVVTPYQGITIVLSRGSIVGLIDVVSYDHPPDLQAQTVADENYVFTVADAPLTNALKEMCARTSQYAIVTKKPGFKGLDDIVGVLTDREIASFCRISANLRS